MTIRNQDIKINRGDSYLIFIALTNADGTPFDPTLNAVFKWRMVGTSHALDEEALIRKDLGSGIEIVTSPADGVTIELSKDDTNLSPGIYYHELKAWDDIDVTTTTTGAFIIRHSVVMVRENFASPAAQQIMLTGTVPSKVIAP